MIKTLTFPDYPTALDTLVNKLKKRVFDADEYYIVLTPDKYTLLVESALFSGGGAMDLEVLTLSRLCRRIADGIRSLSREGSVMLISRAISAVSDKLTYYRRAAKYPDFAREVFSALLQIGSSAVTPDDLLPYVDLSESPSKNTAPTRSFASDVTRDKLRDLALIKAEYDALKNGSYDAPDRLTALIKAVPGSDFIASAHFYAIGYSDATALMTGVFEAIARRCKSFEMYAAEEAGTHAVNAAVYRTPDAVSQYKLVASRINEYIYSGGKPGDVAVVCPDPRTAGRIFNEYGISYYADNSVALGDTPPLSALSALYRTSQNGLERERLIALCKNPFCGCEPRDAELLQDYMTSRALNYVPSDYAITDEPCAARALERAKLMISVFNEKKNFADACAAVLDVFDFDGTAKTLTEAVRSISSDCDVLLTDEITPIRELIGLVSAFGSGAFDVDAEMFFAAARSMRVKALPHSSDRVNVCMPSSLRLSRCKKLFITDFNEGVLPEPTSDGGLLCDAELESFCGAVSPTAREKNRQARAELAAVIYNARDVFITYRTGGARKAAFLSALCAEERDYTEELAELRLSDEPEFIAKYACVPSAAREIAARNLSIYASSLTAAVGDAEMLAAPFEPYAGFAPHRSISVTELTGWFDCPYRRFLAYTVGVAERRDEELSAPDFGLIIHEFMERFVNEKAYTLTDEEIEAAAERIACSILDARDKKMSELERARIVRDACDYALTNTRIIRAGGFLPVLTEYKFDGNIALGSSAVPFTGKIDRVDVCGTDARIIDYKTGGKTFSDRLCRSGRDMQLPLYAAALRGEYNVTGFFYSPMKKMFDTDDRLLSGRLVKTPELALKYDAALESGEPSRIIVARFKEGGNEFYGRSGMLVDADGFDEIVNSCVKTASLAVDEIDSGYIERAPADGACDYCAYSGLCEKKKFRSGKSGGGEE